MFDRTQDLPVSEHKPAEGLGITADELLNELVDMFNIERPEPPMGSFTVRQFMSRTNTTLDKARYFLRMKVEAGELKKIKFTNTDYYYKA